MPSSTTCEAPNVISRSRRRRKQQPASTGSVEKENVIEEQPGVAEDTITKTRSKKTIATTKSTRRTKKPTVKSSTSGSSSKEPSFIWNLSAHETLERSLRTFQSALEKLATEEVNVLKEDESLVKSLVEASFSLSSQREMESSTFLLQEKKKELLSVFRKIVKMVAEDKSKPPESAIQFLCVAVHGLRALLLLSQEVVTNEAILRLLFHALFSASSSISVLSESKTSAKSKKNNLLELFGVAALSTFEAVSVVLRRITLLKDSSGKTKSKECISFKSSNNKIGGSLQFGFPMPGIESSSTNRGYSTSVFQLLTITTQSILALSRVLVALPMTSKGAWASLLLSFKDQGQDQPTKYTITVSLLRQVGLPWVFSMSQYASTKEQSVLLKEGASFCKQGHRILWELASKESKKNPKSEPGVYDECLDLRRHAIALLAGYSGVSSDVAEEFDVGSRIFISYLREKQFANACTLASKATTAYAQQQSPERASAGLTNFHMDVGIAIDRLAGAMEGDESFPYFEYCAYRALHIGPNAWLDDKDESILCSSCQHKNSSKQPCLFSRLPFQYIHHQSLVSPSPQKKNRATLLQESALSLLFLSIQVQKQLNVLLLEKSKENLSMDISMSSQDAAKIVGCFQTLFLPLTSSSIPLTEQLRYFKILSSVQLHSTIFKILSKTASEELVKENENRRIFEIAAEIMTKCAGPFAYSLLQNGDPSIDTKKEAFLSDFVIECYCRSAAVYDALGMADGATYLERSDDIMENIVGILIPDDCSDSYAPPGEHLEKAAKILSSIGKGRVNRNQKKASVGPLLHSMALFTSMSACGNTDVKTCCPSQLSARWTFLASVFQSLGYLDEALLATAGALSCAVTSANELGGENEMTTVSLLNLLASKSYGVFSPFVDTCSLGDEQTRVLIRRLLKNTLEKGVSISLDSPGPFSASQAIQMLRKRMLSRYKKATGSTDVINSNFSLKGEDGFLSLLRSIVGIDFKSSTQTISKIDLVISTVDILGQMIQQRCASDGGIPDNYGLMYEGALGVLMQVVEEMLVCNDIVTEESATAERAVESDIVRFTFRGMIHAIGSSCLLSRSPFLPAVVTGISEATNVVSAEKISSPLHTFACRYLEKSWEAIERETMAETEWACIFSAVRLAIAFCQSNLSVLMNVEDAINSNRSSIVLGAVDEHSIHLLSSNATSSEMLHFCRGCMTWILSRIRDQFSFEGERLLASQLAAWHNSIARYSDEAEERWASSLTSTLLLSGGLLQVASELCAGEEEEISFDRESALETLVELAEAERRIGRCRIELFRTLPGLTSVRSIDEQLGRLKNDVNALGSTFAHSIIAVLQCWVQASALFAISEAAELICDMERAFSCVRSCFQMCQEVACQVNGQKSESSSDMSGLRWIAHLLPTIRLKAREKQIDCLRRTAALYAKIGDHRRTEAYSISALKNSLILPKESMPKAKIKLNELLLLFRSQGTDTIQEQISRRLLLQYKAMSSPHDLVIKEFNDEDSAALIGPQQSQGFSALVSVEDLLSVGNFVYGSPGQSIEHSFQLFYQAASENYESFTSQPSFRDLIVSLRVMTPRVTPERLLAPLSVQLRLGEIRSLLEKLDPDTEKRIFDLCSDITRDDLAPRDCRAWAHYYLGILDLGVARRSGALSRLWEGYSNEDTSRCKRLAVANCIKNARKSFQSAIKLVGQASELLSRLSTRCFALVTGPEMEGMISAMSASMLIHKSIGSAARQAVYYALNPTDPNDQSEEVAGVNLSTKDLFGVFDSGAQSDAEREENLQSLLDELYSRTPNNWRFVAVALCPGGDILVSQLEKDCDAACFRSETVCIFPPQESANISGSLFSNHTYESILSHLDSLIKKSQQQLGGVMTAEEAAEKFKNESAKRRWWKERKRTDDELRNLIESVETKYFSTLAAHRVLYGKEESAFVADESFDSCSSDSSTFGLCGDLTSRFEAASRDDPSTPARSRRSSARDSKPSSAEEPKGNDACTILILDENFHRFPFEGMPSFVNRPVCRLPSLPFALSSLKGSLSESEASSEGPLIDPRNIRYVLDPEANLIETQERILPFIEDINAQNRWEWEGVVGEVPSKEFVEDGLTRENGLLLYCGHGGGQACFRRSQIENLMKGRSQDEGASSSTVDLPCRATVILMGCSSGKLESVNRKGTSSVANLPIFYEPEGIALSYLLAGAPCVVGNLWDVTDHDIDRYCIQLLNNFLVGASSDREISHQVSLPQAVAEARSACKMPCIVGCAPVCYGIPIHLLDTKSKSKQ